RHSNNRRPHGFGDIRADNHRRNAHCAHHQFPNEQYRQRQHATKTARRYGSCKRVAEQEHRETTSQTTKEKVETRKITGNTGPDQRQNDNEESGAHWTTSAKPVAATYRAGSAISAAPALITSMRGPGHSPAAT